LLLWLIAHTEVLFPVLFVVLILLVEFGFRMRRASPETSAEIQSVIESARDLGLLLGFSLSMSLPHYEQRTQLVTDEANAIATVEQRAQILPEPLRDKILRPLPEYVNSRLVFASADLDGPAIIAAINDAKRLQEEMWQGTVMVAQQNLNPVNPTVIQAVRRVIQPDRTKAGYCGKTHPGCHLGGFHSDLLADLVWSENWIGLKALRIGPPTWHPAIIVICVHFAHS
jgi:hypothetical protein